MQARRRVGYGLRVVATVVMFAVLVTRVHFTSFVPHWDIARRPAAHRRARGHLRRHRPGVAAVAAGAVRLLIFRTGCRSFSRPTWRRCSSATSCPPPSAGDVLRVRRISSENGETPRTFASVVLERLTGWVVLPLFTLAALVINPTLMHQPGGDRRRPRRHHRVARHPRPARSPCSPRPAIRASAAAWPPTPAGGGSRAPSTWGSPRFRQPAAGCARGPGGRHGLPAGRVAAAFLAGRATGLPRRLDRVHGVHAGGRHRPGAALPDHRWARAARGRTGAVPRARSG